MNAVTVNPGAGDARSTLQIVSTELNAEIDAARAALEATAEHPEDAAQLEKFAAHLHLVQGALRVSEVYGGALLAEEMEQVARHVATQAAAGRREVDGLDALMRAVEQLPSYVDRVLSGGRDVPLALLPLLNDLRAVRGGALLSEGTLLTLNLQSDDSVPAIGSRPADVAAIARKLRPRFQLALLGWIRGEDPHRNLAALAEIGEQVELAARSKPVYQVWWVVGAVLEALRAGGLDATASVKRLLGHADRELKRLIAGGEPAEPSPGSQQLLNNLLFYVARATTRGPRVAAVGEAFRLAEVLPPESEIDVAEQTLSAPSVRLMKTVAAAIREDLTRVKDVLDIFVRRGAAQIEELVPQLEMLRKISDTLGVLGLGAQRDRVQVELALLKSIVDQRVKPDDTALLRIAAALIEVEDGLDDQLVRLIVKDPAAAAGDAAGGDDPDFLKVEEAVLRECLVNLARIKEAVTQALGAPNEAQGLDQVPQLARGVTAALLMLGRERAVAVSERIGRGLARIVRPDREAFDGERLDRLADALVAIEYYMETLQAGRTEPVYLLENAERCLEAIECSARPAAAPVPVSYEPTTIMPAPVFPPSAEPIVSPAAARAADASSSPAHDETQVALAPVFAAEAGAEPEIIALFVEEARENVATLETLFPRWEQDPQDLASLREVRRAFHTLKGSGRIVGAGAVADFAWSVESLLNRVLSQTLPRSPEIVSVVRAAIDALPSLITSLERNAAADPAIAAIAARADSLAGRETLLVLPAGHDPGMSVEEIELSGGELPDRDADRFEPESVETSTQTIADDIEAALEQSGHDPLLRDIFRNEAAGHVAIIRDFLQRSGDLPPPASVTEALYRACHTLSGIAKTAGIRQGCKVAEPMDRVVRKLYDSGRGIGGDVLALMRDTVVCLEEIVAHLDEDTGYFPSQPRLVAAWQQTERTVDEEARHTDAGADRGGDGIEVVEGLLGDEAATDSEQIATLVITEQDLAGLIESDGELTAPELVLPTDPHAPLVPQALIDGVTSLHEEAVAAEPQPAPGPEAAPDDAAGASAELAYDPEIAAIFGEEATELLEQAQAALSAWSRDRVDRAQLALLKRVLHTLKGGARMAGLRAMGDLSHELESFLVAIELEPALGTTQAITGLQRSLDELHRMREVTAQGQSPAAADALVAGIRALARGETPEAGEPVESVDAVQPVEPAEVEAPAAAAHEPAPASHDWAEIFTPANSATTDAGFVAPPPPSLGEALQPGVAPLATAPPAGEEPAVAQPRPPLPGTEAAVAGLPGRAGAPVAPERGELARVDADLLDELLNNAGEVSIFRARVEQQMTQTEFNLAELGRTVTRLREQLRNLEIETEAQILYRHQGELQGRPEFDPLELDRYSSIQQFSRALAESVSDVASLEAVLQGLNRDAQNLLHQQSRIVTELQNGLMRTRMVPFQRHVQRLARIVRQVAQETGKQAELLVEGASGELDRQVLERMLPPFEHMLRNSVVHGLETPAERVAAGKPEAGQIRMSLQREGAEVVIAVADDGAGLNLQAIRAKALQAGLVRPGQTLTDDEALQLILEPGFSTADRLTQQAGRGVGMDVVASEVKKLGGGLYIESMPGQGARFTIRLPFTLAITQALIVRVGDELYALPVATVEGVARVPRADVQRYLGEESPTLDYGQHPYRFQPLGGLLGCPPPALPDSDAALPVILVRAGEHSAALLADELVGSREIVVKPVGPQIAAIRGISGATILGDGRIVLILDSGALVRSEWRLRGPAGEVQPQRDERVCALVVDDSITVRRVTQRLLKRNGMRVLTAKDGVDALSLLQEHVPDVILLDIEMPRMDGYELAAHVRGDPRLAAVPIIMITSRVGEKHRARAIELGVDDYLGKPYQESQLLDAIEPLVARHRVAS
jgi:chemosensory pili system protein ChpA (sensor histidine kinase/response regulator)